MRVDLRGLNKGRAFLSVVLFFAFCLTAQAQTKEVKPRSKWALGLGAGWLSDYPAAAQGRLRFIPFPVIRGSFFRVDRISGVSGDMYNDSRLDFSWNFIFQFPTDSDDIPARVGMPDLDWLLSLGPEIKYYIYRQGHHKTFFRMPVRLNTCTNFAEDTRFCGVAINPGIRHVMVYEGFGEFTWRWEAFSQSSEYQQYFYEVPNQFATASRPAFHARAGFLGFAYGLFHSLPFDGWDLSTAINVYDYSLGINHESPLFLHKTNYALFMAITVDLEGV